MAVVSWQVSDVDLPRLIAALADSFGYQPFIGDGRPNPETRPNFVHRMVAEEWRRKTVLYERRLAQEAVPMPEEPGVNKT